MQLTFATLLILIMLAPAVRAQSLDPLTAGAKNEGKLVIYASAAAQQLQMFGMQNAQAVASMQTPAPGGPGGGAPPPPGGGAPPGGPPGGPPGMPPGAGLPPRPPGPMPALPGLPGL